MESDDSEDEKEIKEESGEDSNESSNESGQKTDNKEITSLTKMQGEEENSRRSDFSIFDYSVIFSYTRHGHYKEVSMLFDKGAKPDVRDDNGNTVLIVAAQNNYKHIAKLSLLKGTEIDAVNHTGNTALHYCTEYGHIKLGDYLLQKGANPFVTNLYGYTAIEGVYEDKHRLYDHLKFVRESSNKKLA